MGVVDGLRQAREAYERRDWLAAYDVLSDVAPEDLGADDFARLATAAHLLGRRNDAVLAMQRAYQVHVAAGEVLEAVRSGLIALSTKAEQSKRWFTFPATVEFDRCMPPEQEPMLRSDK